MRRLPVAAAAALEAGQERLAHLWLLLRAQPRLLAVVAGSCAALLLGVYVVLRLLAHDAAPLQSSPAEPRYLAVCGACGWRATFSQHPSQTLAHRGALLRCTQCSAYQVTWYRRGGQTAPPGGWSTVAAPTSASQTPAEAGP